MSCFFEMMNGVVVPTVHCKTLKTLRTIEEEYPDNYMKIYEYLFYMFNKDEKLNPFFHAKAEEKEEDILSEIEADFSTEDDTIAAAIDFCRKYNSTASSRAYDGFAIMMDRIGTYMADTAITDGKDGNIAQIRAVAKDFDAIRQSFKATYQDLKDEQSTKVRGDKKLSYDQS